MCGRYALKETLEHLMSVYGAVPDGFFELNPVYNAAPSFDLPVVIQDDHERVIGLRRWGLLPGWAKDEKLAYSLINARAETIDRKPSFREAFKKRRCVVPVSGFYEWKKTPDGKVPHYISPTGDAPFSLAGLHEHWTSPEGKAINTFTIITTGANSVMRSLHDRMPAILSGKEVDLWLDPQNRDTAVLQDLLRPAPDDGITFFPVSSEVNSPRNQGAELIEPVNSG